MQAQRSEVIDFAVARRKRDARVARRLMRETMRIRRPIPRLPRFGIAAAVLVETSDALVDQERDPGTYIDRQLGILR